MVTAIAVFTAVGIVALMAFYFVIAGGSTVIMAIVLALAALLIGLIGRAVLQSPRSSEP
jgi:hypothetical protein